MKFTRSSILLSLTFSFLFANQAPTMGSSTTLDAILRGHVEWLAIGGPGFEHQEWNHEQYSPTAGYDVGRFFSSSGEEFSSSERRNYFKFDLSALSIDTWVTDAKLQLEHSGITSHSLTYQTLSVSVDPLTSSAFHFFESGFNFGVVYGSASVAGASSGDVLEVALNTTALTDINAAHRAGDPIDFGGTITATSNVNMFVQTGNGDLTQLALTHAPNSLPVAAHSPPSILLGDGVTFDGSGSQDADITYGDSIEAYAWDLDDDGFFDFSGPSATLALNATDLANFGIDATGAYDIALRVTDAWGAQDMNTQSLTVTTIPEPTSLLFASLAGLFGLGTTHRRRIL